MSRHRPPASPDDSRDRDRDRGQTAQDFAVGVSVFLLAVASVFLFVPNVTTPFVSDVGTGPQADQAATVVVTNLSETGSATTLNATETEARFHDWRTGGDVHSLVGLETWASINVTVYTLDGEDVVTLSGPGRTTRLTAGTDYAEQPAASATRIVSIDGQSNCCRLVVKVW